MIKRRHFQKYKKGDYKYNKTDLKYNKPESKAKMLYIWIVNTNEDYNKRNQKKLKIKAM